MESNKDAGDESDGRKEQRNLQDIRIAQDARRDKKRISFLILNILPSC
jgi:hypothetical protein